MRALVSVVVLATCFLYQGARATMSIEELVKKGNPLQLLTEFSQKNPQETVVLCEEILANDFFSRADAVGASRIKYLQLPAFCQTFKAQVQRADPGRVLLPSDAPKAVVSRQKPLMKLTQPKIIPETKANTEGAGLHSSAKISITNDTLYDMSDTILEIGLMGTRPDIKRLTFPIPKKGASKTFDLPRGKEYDYIDFEVRTPEKNSTRTWSSTSTCWVDKQNPINTNETIHLKVTFKQKQQKSGSVMCYFSRD